MRHVMMRFVVAFLLMAILSIAVSADGLNGKGYDVEIYANGELNHIFELLPPKPGHLTYSFSIYGVPNGRVAKTAEGEQIYAFQIVPQLEGGFVKVEVLALLEDPSTISEDHPLHKFKKQVVAAYSLSAGESITVTEMSSLGVEPLKIRVVSRG
jgi:hypothetical protein